MNRLALTFFLAISIAAPARASDQTDVVATVHRFVDGYNKGDMQSATATCAGETSIIDNFPPYEWHGPGACAKWASDLEAAAKQLGITDGFVTLGKALHVDVTGDRAYIVVSARFRYKLKGKSVAESADVAVALQKDATAWKMTALAWAQK